MIVKYTLPILCRDYIINKKNYLCVLLLILLNFKFINSLSTCWTSNESYLFNLLYFVDWIYNFITETKLCIYFRSFKKLKIIVM